MNGLIIKDRGRGNTKDADFSVAMMQQFIIQRSEGLKISVHTCRFAELQVVLDIK